MLRQPVQQQQFAQLHGHVRARMAVVSFKRFNKANCFLARGNMELQIARLTY